MSDEEVRRNLELLNSGLAAQKRDQDELTELIATLQGGATKIQGLRVSSLAPTAAYVLAWNASTKLIEWVVSSTPSAHVLASTTGLGAAHTVAGLTARQVLIATGAATALFRALQDADIPAAIARDSEVTADIATHAAAADPHTGYQKESEKAAANGYMGLDANQYGTDPPQAHVHLAAGSGGALYSVHQYVFTPDAAPGADVATGAHQGMIHVSGPSTETVKRITAIAETAAGTAFTFTLDYDSGNDDFDTFTVDTEIDSVAMGTAKGVVVSAGFTTGTIAARSLISLDVTTVTGSAPKDVTIILEAWRPLQS